MKNFIILLLLLFANKCSLPNRLEFKYYNSNTEDQRKKIINSIAKFNNLIGCEAVIINFIEENIFANNNNNTNEIQIVDSNSLKELFFKTNNEKYKIDENSVISGFTTIKNKTSIDIFISSDEIKSICSFSYENFCIYDDFDLTMFHELGHAFGLKHETDKSKIMSEIREKQYTAFDFIHFINELRGKTNVCKGISI